MGRDPFVVLCFFMSFLADASFLHRSAPLPIFFYPLKKCNLLSLAQKKIELLAVFNIKYNHKDSSLLYVKTNIIYVSASLCMSVRFGGLYIRICKTALGQVDEM